MDFKFKNRIIAKTKTIFMKQRLGKSWELSSLWNKSLLTIPERPLMPRNYIYASELLGSYVDRYLKMNAVPMTNKPNDRSLRKFSAGHMFEWVIGLVLTLTGVLKSRQLRGEYQLPGMLQVAGKFDFIAGGEVDWEKAKEEVKNIQKLFSISLSDMPPIVFHAIEQVINSFEKEFKNNPLKEVIFECKSVSSFMSDKIERTNKPMPHHVLQCQHYLLANEMDEAYLFYISKDDMIGHQFSVYNDKETLLEYANDVKQMTEYYNNGFDAKNPLKFAPPKEKEVIFDDSSFRFTTNYKVEYSSYLTMLYPEFSSPMAYRMKWDKQILAWNRVFKRVVKGDKITASNQEYINQIKVEFPDWEKFVELAKQSDTTIEEDENE